jgi:acyl-CoA carboxylase subunit beta
MTRLGAHDFIELVLDADSWVSWDTAPSRLGISEEYAAELAAARTRRYL